MSANAWRKNHTVTAGLVRRFAGATPGGKQVTVRHRGKGEYPEGPGGVGWELDYWGPQALAETVEGFLARNESDALRLLENLKSRWPLTDEDRVTLGRFVSLHIVRTPVFSEWLRALGSKTAKAVLAEAAVEHDLNDEQIAPYAERLASPQMRSCRGGALTSLSKARIASRAVRGVAETCRSGQRSRYRRTSGGNR
jgi:hypothetical protein